MEKSVRLLSSFAESFFQSSSSPSAAKKGFWNSVRNFFSSEKNETTFRKPSLGKITPEELKARGYTGFAQVREVAIWVKSEGNSHEIVFLEKGESWNLEEWGDGSTLKSRLIAELYFLVTKDDFQIDKDEAVVMLAFTSFVKPTADEISDAKTMVYWTLVESVMEDGIITEEEQGTMAKITTALDLSSAELTVLHERAIESQLQETFEGPRPDEEVLSRVEKTVQMARTLKIDEKRITQLVEQTRATKKQG